MVWPSLVRIVAIVLLTIGVAYRTVAQRTVIYRSYDAFRSGNGEESGTYKDIRKKGGVYELRLQRDGHTHEVKCTEIWGLTVNDVLFRIHPVDGVPVRLMAQGAVCYYENGFAHLRMQRTGSELEPSGPGSRSYLGRTLDGEVVPAVFKDDDGPSARFRSGNPQLEPLFHCIGEHDDLNNTRQCVVDFEAMLEGDGHLRAGAVNRQ